MAKRKNVAIIGLSALEAIAVKELLRHHPAAAAESFAGFSGFTTLSQQFDAFVCDAQTYLLHPSFFMPRRKNTLVVFHGPGSGRSIPGDSLTAENLQKSYYLEEKSEPECNFSEIPESIFTDSDETHVEAALARVLSDSQRAGLVPSSELSSREKEVLGLVAAGLTNKEIADRLCISVNTAITHRKNISSKLGIKSASGLSLYALMNGII